MKFSRGGTAARLPASGMARFPGARALLAERFHVTDERPHFFRGEIVLEGGHLQLAIFARLAFPDLLFNFRIGELALAQVLGAELHSDFRLTFAVGAMA